MYLTKKHIHLNVDDAAESALFYEALLGAPPARRSEFSAVFDSDSPPLVLTVEQRPVALRPGRARSSREHFALVVTMPQHVGVAAIALRRAGIQLRLEDEGIRAQDPDGNPWRVRCVPSAPGRSVVVT
jgi:catechol-2,3-dioxygenase